MRDLKKGPPVLNASSDYLVLMVEAEFSLRLVIRAVLESAGLRVAEACDGREALAAIQKTPPDLILTCLHLPHLDGLSLIGEVRRSKATARIPIIVLSARTGREDQLRALLAGANDYVTKPWDSRDLTVRIKNTIAWTQGQTVPTASPLFNSCFISYASADEALASQLHRDLTSAGIACWKWNEDAKAGERLWGEIDRAIRAHDKVILLASEAALKSPAVNRELERALREEDDRAGKRSRGVWDGSIEVLIPVRLDDYLFMGWENERKADVLRKVVADGSRWREQGDAYKRLRDRLVNDLRLEDR